MARRPIVALGCLPKAHADEIADYLVRRGYEVRRADEEWELRPLLVTPQVDVIVLGDELPSAAVLGLLRHLQSDADPAAILVRAKTELVETVLALELGAADVVDAPADMRELAARIAGLLVAPRQGALRTSCPWKTRPSTSGPPWSCTIPATKSNSRPGRWRC